MLFDDSSDESFALIGELVDLLLDWNHCSEGDVLELLFGVFVGDEHHVVGVEDDAVALFIWQFQLELPVVHFHVFVYIHSHVHCLSENTSLKDSRKNSSTSKDCLSESTIFRLFLLSNLKTSERVGQGRFRAFDLRKSCSSFIMESSERSSDIVISGQINI